MDYAKSRPADIATHYAGRGWRVLPVMADEKRPAIRNGVKDATADLDLLQDYFTELSKNGSRPNIGVATGKASGFFVVDIDYRNDADAFLHAAELCGFDELADPDTIQVDTPSGGQHWYFKMPEEPVGNFTNLLPGVDIKGDGGYVLAPGSIINGKLYAFGREGEIADAPAALLERLKRAPKGNGEDLHWPGEEHKKVSEGGRNHALTALAGKLWNCDLEPPELYAAIMERNKTYAPPLPDSEVRAIVQSASRNFERTPQELILKPAWPFRNLEAIKTLDLPPRAPVIGPFATAATTVVAAMRGTGKTLFMTAVADCVAAGCAFCDWPCCQQGRVAFVQLDMPIHAVQKRALSAEWHPDLHYVTRYDFQQAGLPTPDLGNAKHHAAVIEALRGYRMVVFDTRRAAQPPGQGAAANMWNPAYWLASAPVRHALADAGVALVFLDHLTADGQVKDTKSIEDDVDCIVTLKDTDKGTQELCFQLELSKDRDHLREECFFEFDGTNWRQFTDTSLKRGVFEYRQDHTIKQTAEEFNLSERTVKNYVREVRAEIRERLQGDGQGNGSGY